MRAKSQILDDQSGNFGLMFALLSVPVMLAGGLAVDYVGLSLEKSELQNAADAAALAVAREGNITEEQAHEIARRTVAANYGLTAAKVSAILKDGVASIHASMDRPLVFGGFMGKTSTPVTVNAEATYAFTKYEIALVLDTTGSMAGGKLTSMKDAVIGLVDGMAAMDMPKDQIKFSLVPYASFVNVGPEFGPKLGKLSLFKERGAEWLDQDAISPLQQSDLPNGLSRFAMYDHLGVKWPGCVETRIPRKGAAHDVDDTEPTLTDPKSLFIPTFAIDEPDNPYRYPNSYLPDKGVPVVASGKAGSDDDDDDDDDDENSAAVKRLERYGKTGTYTTPKNLFDALLLTLKWKKIKIDDSPSRFYSSIRDPKGPGFGCDVEPIVPLTSNASDITKIVKKLEAKGSTNMLEGVMWGWRVLSNREPFTDGAAKSEGSVEKIMIFLTDGKNSLGNLNNSLGSGYSSFGYLVDGRLDGITAASSGQTNTALDKKTLAACTNAKKDGVTIYTIRLEEPDVSTGEMLSQCATSKSHFFDAPSRQQLTPIFDAIKKGVVKLRLTS